MILREFIESAIHIHDDWRCWSRYDEHSGLPLFIGAHSVVTPYASLYPQRYVELLKELDVWPRHVFEPKSMGILSAITQLVEDSPSLNSVVDHIKANRLQVSLFYPNHPYTQRFLSKLPKGSAEHMPSDDTNPIHRARTIGILRDNGVSTLPGALVKRRASLPLGLDGLKECVCKTGHGDTFVLPYSLLSSLESVAPVYVEERMDVMRTFCLHFSGGEHPEYIAGNEQIIREYRHCGNKNTAIPREVRSLALRAATLIATDSPVVGIDVLETPQGYFVCDVNERFNTSTYVHLLLARLYDLEEDVSFLFMRCVASRSVFTKATEDLSRKQGARNDLVMGASCYETGEIVFYRLIHSLDQEWVDSMAKGLDCAIF